MSIPIMQCLIFKAARGDEAAYQRFIKHMTENMNKGHFSVWPCKCDPPCEMPTDEQFEAMERRMMLQDEVAIEEVSDESKRLK